jgi:hypothetical protein
MTVISETQDNAAAISAYYKAISAYLSATGVDGDITTIDGQLPFADLLTYVHGAAQQSGSFAVGLGIEACSDFFSTQRELDMSRLTKTELMSSAAGEASEDAQIYSDTAVFRVGALQGSDTSGSQI